MTLSDKLRIWGKMKAHLTRIEEDIKQEVLALKKTQQVGNVTAKYHEGRGFNDYPKIAAALSISKERIEAFTETKSVIDWISLFTEVKIPEDIRRKYYTPGKPSVNLKLTQTVKKIQKGETDANRTENKSEG